MANNKNNHKKNSNNNINKKSNRKKHNVNRKKKTSAKARKARRTKAIIIGAIVAISIIALIVLLFIYKRKSEESGIQAIGNDATDVNVLLKNGENKTWESISIACDNGMTWSASMVISSACSVPVEKRLSSSMTASTRGSALSAVC